MRAMHGVRAREQIVERQGEQREHLGAAGIFGRGNGMQMG